MSGVSPTRHVVIHTITRVANVPVMIFIVAIMRIGKARHIPSIIPNTALFTRLYNIRN